MRIQYILFMMGMGMGMVNPAMNMNGMSMLRVPMAMGLSPGMGRRHTNA